MFKQEETPVLDTKQLFKQTAWKSIGFRLLAMVIAVGATVCSIFIAAMLYDVLSYYNFPNSLRSYDLSLQ